jgi:predicted lipoprotein
LNKYIKYVLLIAVIALAAYKSVYFEKLSARKNNNTNAATVFDAAAFSKKLWADQFPARLDNAIELSALIDAVNKNSATAFTQNTNALAVGNYRYALVKFDATVTEVKEDEVLINIQSGDSVLQATLATEFIYGNAIRDASGLVQVKDYPNTNDLNSISEALNKIVRTEVVPSFKSAIKKGNILNVVAAIELNKEHIHWQGLEFLPLRISIK